MGRKLGLIGREGGDARLVSDLLEVTARGFFFFFSFDFCLSCDFCLCLLSLSCIRFLPVPLVAQINVWLDGMFNTNRKNVIIILQLLSKPYKLMCCGILFMKFENEGVSLKFEGGNNQSKRCRKELVVNNHVLLFQQCLCVCMHVVCVLYCVCCVCVCVCEREREREREKELLCVFLTYHFKHTSSFLSFRCLCCHSFSRQF